MLGESSLFSLSFSYFLENLTQIGRLILACFYKEDFKEGPSKEFTLVYLVSKSLTKVVLSVRMLLGSGKPTKTVYASFLRIF